jgi:hypothetical protein
MAASSPQPEETAMRSHLVLTAALIACATTTVATTALAQTQEMPVCPSREAAEMVMQGGAGAPLPEGCRQATVRRLDTPAGPVCVIDFGTRDGGVVGTVRDAVATTEWWTACANLRSP